MSRSVSSRILKILTLSAGLLGLLLRFTLLHTAVDEKGLLVTGHWADTGVWLLTAAVIGVIFLVSRHCASPACCDTAVFPSILRCAGSLVAACGFLLSGSPTVTAARLALAEPVLRILAAIALVAVAYCRFRGKKTTFLLHGIVCLYLALRMVCRYQIWSADPQLQHYAFYLGAHVALLLSSYHLSAFDAGSGNHRSLWCWALAAVYLCLTALPGCDEPFFLLCCALWMLSSLTSAEGA